MKGDRNPQKHFQGSNNNNNNGNNSNSNKNQLKLGIRNWDFGNRKMETGILKTKKRNWE